LLRAQLGELLLNLAEVLDDLSLILLLQIRVGQLLCDLFL